MSSGAEANRETSKPSSIAPSVSPAPGMRLVVSLVLVLLIPPILAALMPSLPAALRAYLPQLPLPLLEVELALVFAVFALPVFNSPSAAETNPFVTGLARGCFLGLVALPFVMTMSLVWPVSTGAVLAGCALVAVAGAGAASAAAAFGNAGLAAGIAAFVLPGLFGFFGAELELPLGWLQSLCPFVAAETAARGGAGWTLGLLPGVILLAISALARPKTAQA